MKRLLWLAPALLLASCGGTTTREIVREVVVVTATPTATTEATAATTAPVPAPATEAPTLAPVPTATPQPVIFYQAALTPSPDPPSPTVTPGPRLTAAQAVQLAGGLAIPSGGSFADCVNNDRFGGHFPFGVSAKLDGKSGVWAVMYGLNAYGFTFVTAFVDDATLTAHLGLANNCR